MLKINKIFKSMPTLEGAGVKLKRALGFNEVPLFDPFLLLDDFRSDNPDDYIRGFPWHPHRGIETITYVLQGDVEHGDSLGNNGVIGPGDVQWMTAGSGIIHQEMPKGNAEGKMHGFQLWANLPAKNKMMDPRYREINSKEIPELKLPGGALVKIICGELSGVKGPAQDIVIEPEYLDVSLPPNSEFRHTVKPGHTVFAYIINGSGFFSEEKNQKIENTSLVLFDDGDEITAFSEKTGMRFLLISGKPLGEPVAWRGPIVMNTQEELKTAFDEYAKSKFIKIRK